VGVTSRLYYTDSYLCQFEATLTSASADGLEVELDRSAFYPTSGGQLFDLGTLNSIPVVDIVETDDGRVLHRLASPISAGPIRGEIDFSRRFDFMQQHSGQHLLSAVFESMFGFKTVGVHMGESSSTVDLETGSISRDQLVAAEYRINAVVFENRPISIGFEDAAQAEGLRKATERTGDLRIVTIQGYDRSACGGTHVRSTGEIGPVLLRRMDKIRGNVRVEFLCGLRAVRRARQDYDTLDAAARVFNAQLDDLPVLAASSVEQSKEADKARKKLSLELAQLRGRQLWESQPVSASGRRVYIDSSPTGPLDDETRALALSFTAQPGAIFVTSSPNPPTLLLAVSEDTGLHAGNLLKPLLVELGGRGGGNARTAQGTLPTPEAVAKLIAKLNL
jgi:alanyl-tRNA synthetase